MFGIFSKSKKTSSKKKPGKKKSKKGDAEANTEASSQPKSFFLKMQRRHQTLPPVLSLLKKN